MVVVFNLVVLASAAGSSSLPLLFDFFAVAEGSVDVLSDDDDDDDDDDDGCVVLVETVTLLHEEASEDPTTTWHFCSPGTLSLVGELNVVDLEEDDDGCFLDCFFDLLDEASVGARRGIMVLVNSYSLDDVSASVSAADWPSTK